MKKLILSLLFFVQFVGFGMSQDISLIVEINSDTLLLGNYVHVKYTIENAQCKFVMPELDGLRIISGPNTSSSMSMINGEMKQSASYSFYAQALDIGPSSIGPAYFETDNGTFESQPITINVIDNPDGKTVNSPSLKVVEDISITMDGEKTKKKRRAKRHKI